MSAIGIGGSLARIARRLAAAARGSRAGLRAEIRRTRSAIDQMESCRLRLPAGDEERLELLNALIDALRQPLACPDGAQVHIRLLEHLAGPAARSVN